MTKILRNWYYAILFVCLWASSHGFQFDVKLGDLGDATSHSWKFPKDWPYHYYKSTKEVAPDLLPVPINSLPTGDGIWLLTHQDFLDLPRLFTQHQSNKSVVHFESSGNLFHSVTVKAFAFGEVQLGLMTEPENEAFIMFAQNDNCTDSSDEINELRWTIYDMNVERTAKVRLEAAILQPQSFIILDEVTFHFGTPVKFDIDDEIWMEVEQENYQKKMSCKII